MISSDARGDVGDQDRGYAAPALLAEDQKLWEVLSATGFSGPLYDRFVDRLVRYALPPVERALVTGRMFHQCRRRCGFDLHMPAHWNKEDREEIALSVIERALVRFTELARSGSGWSFDRGITLTTYFYGLCVDAFSNVFRAWLRYANGHLPLSQSYMADGEGRLSADPAVRAAEIIDLRRSVDGLPPEQRDALLLHYHGYSYQEIGNLLGRSTRAVEGLIYRARERLRNRHSGGLA